MIEFRSTTFSQCTSAVALALATWPSCGCTRSTPGIGPKAQQATQSEQATEIFKYAVVLLNGIDESDAAPAVREDDSSTLLLHEAAEKLIEGGTAVTVVDQLNQWIKAQKPLASWRRSSLLETLPESLGKGKVIQGLDAMSFPLSDAAELRQAVWLRGVALTATRQATDDLDRATRLFDWVVRNIQLEPSDGSVPAVARLPWQTMVTGHGQAIDRAWVFTLLARQQGLDVVQLARKSADAGEAEATGLSALVHDGELYLFDPWLGLPLPAPGGQRVATLAQAAADDSVLRRLDLDDEHVYPLRSSDLDQVVALVEASPSYLSQRMWMVESHLAGEQRLVLALDADDVATRLLECAHVGEVRIWPFPYRRLLEAARRKRADGDTIPLVVVADPLLREMEPFVLPFGMKRKKSDKPQQVAALWRGRVLHLLGKYTGDEGSNYFYQLSRPPEIDLERQAFEAVEMAKRSALGGPEAQAIAVKFVSDTEAGIAFVRRAKQNASYWLGLAAFERALAEQREELYTTALDYFQERTLAATPAGPWTHGADYNLGRTFEALGRIDEARDTYLQDDASPQHHGNALRARWLEETKQ